MPQKTEELIKQIDLHFKAFESMSLGQGMQMMCFTNDECHVIRDALQRSLNGGKDADIGR